MVKPKYKIGQRIVGRPTSETKVEDGEQVMVEIDSARYESKYGQWVYSGTVYTDDLDGQQVEIYEYEVTQKVRGK